MESEPFWSRPAAAVLADLGTAGAGLSSGEAAARLKAFGPNRLRGVRRATALELLARQFGSPLVLLLVGAAVLSLALRETGDAVIIVAIVLASGLLGFFQEWNAADAVAKLLALVAVKATALRDGQPREVPVEEVVPGDLILLSAGSLVPGDALVVEGKDLFLDEAALTGETFPVDKRPAGAESPPDRGAALFLGTHVVSGTGKAVVVATGAATELGHISARLNLRPPETDFERGLERFGFLLVRVTGALVLCVFAVHVFLARPFLESFMFSLALAVGLVPELLPAIVSVNLARGARRMARAKVIVKKLTAIESFGGMTVLCSDKTGTLTEGKVRLAGALDVDGEPSGGVFRCAALNAAFESGFVNPIDRAIRDAGPVDLTGVTKLDEVPYDFVRKRLSVLVEERGVGRLRRLITKGAFHQVLAVCSRAGGLKEGADVPIGEVRAALEEKFAALSAAGLRTLGLAVRDLPAGPPAATAATKDQESEMTFVGLLTFTDSPKAGVEAALAELAASGVGFKLVTGDNREVALAVAREVGIAEPVALTGAELARMSPRAIDRRVADVNVFAEVEPNQKEQIILALRRGGEAVGFLGDGINDAPALHAADIGISVDSAVDVAKEAADIVLLERDLSVLVEGVREGRRTFANTLKYVFITTSANFGNMVSMAAAALFLPFLPLLPTQILLNNFLSDFPAMTIATDRVDPELVARPARWNLRFIRDFMVVFGGISSVFDLATFAALGWLLHATPERFRSGWFVESVLTELAILLVIRTRRPLWKSRSSRALAISTALVSILSVALLYLPVNRFFSLQPLPLGYLAVLITITVGYVAASEAAKGWFFRRAAAVADR